MVLTALSLKETRHALTTPNKRDYKRPLRNRPYPILTDGVILKLYVHKEVNGRDESFLNFPWETFGDRERERDMSRRVGGRVPHDEEGGQTEVSSQTPSERDVSE